jgi:hypothetical protein
VTPAPETLPDTCVVGFKDWTHRDPCGEHAVCEVRQIRETVTGRWVPSCGPCADGFEYVIRSKGRVFERRDPAWVRDLNNPPLADVIPLHAERNGDTNGQ